jgi:hypothetical protein
MFGAVEGVMHMRNAILLSTLIAFVAALGYGLRQLSQSMELGPFFASVQRRLLGVRISAYD